jgi:hypothetical protein
MEQYCQLYEEIWEKSLVIGMCRPSIGAATGYEAPKLIKNIISKEIALWLNPKRPKAKKRKFYDVIS